jgi:non-lysosomal glucosylceramidase
MGRESGSSRRDFLQQAAAAGAASKTNPPAEPKPPHQAAARRPSAAIAYPRQFEGPHLKMISFPLGGVAAGSIGLGGRGQLRDWEIFNKPDKGGAPAYAFPSIWVQMPGRPAVARVLEARIEPPYEGASGLGANNAPGLARLEAARFTGEYPLARIDFSDRDLPVKISLEGFSPFIPHDAEESGLPVAVLR